MKSLILVLLLILTPSLCLCKTTPKRVVPYKVVLDCNKNLFTKFLQFIDKQVGVKEKSNKNDGVQVEAYLKSIGLSKGYPYCQAGIYYCFQEAAKVLCIDKSKIPILRSGSTVAVFNNAKLKGKKSSDPNPKIGSSIYWRFPNKAQGHVETIKKIINPFNVLAVGFNTSSGTKGSQNDGGGVYIRYRSLIDQLGRMNFFGIIEYNLI